MIKSGPILQHFNLHTLLKGYFCEDGLQFWCQGWLGLGSSIPILSSQLGCGLHEGSEVCSVCVGLQRVAQLTGWKLRCRAGRSRNRPATQFHAHSTAPGSLLREEGFSWPGVLEVCRVWQSVGRGKRRAGGAWEVRPFT